MRKTPVVVGVLVGSARLGWSVGFLCCLCVGVCVFGVALALSLSFLGFLGSFVCGLINLLAFIVSGSLGLVLWLVWFGCSLGLVWNKKDNKKTGFILPVLFYLFISLSMLCIKLYI
jgi:hypothetical protein